MAVEVFVSSQPKTLLTPEQYLELERKAAHKSEYFQAEMFAMQVLPPSTEGYDRGRKFEHYRTIESLREYLLLASDRVQADLYTRQEGDGWLLTSAGRMEDSVALESIDCRLALADLYGQIDLPASE